ncbi:MAG: hypothetical protein QHH02_03490 [Syntrophomonadaceae bacterium]|nr:hypothetical protein [Syntrophomonadaceae bacterium]
MGSLAPTLSFKLGKVKITNSAFCELSFLDVADAIKRHLRGDWGEVTREDWQVNDYAAEHGLCIRSVYTSANGTEFYIVTKGDRQSTIILLPDEFRESLKN